MIIISFMILSLLWVLGIDNQSILHSSVSEQLITQSERPVKEQADQLISNTSQVISAICSEFEALYKSRLITCREQAEFTDLLKQNLRKILWENSIVKGIFLRVCFDWYFKFFVSCTFFIWYYMTVGNDFISFFRLMLLYYIKTSLFLLISFFINFQGKDLMFEGLPGEFTRALLEQIEFDGVMRNSLKFESTVEPVIYTTQPRELFQKELDHASLMVSGCSSFILDDTNFKHLHNLYSVLVSKFDKQWKVEWKVDTKNYQNLCRSTS